MTTITTRSGKGSPLTNDEVDANFTNLNTDKAELSGAAFTGAITTNSTVDGRDVATDGTKLDGIEASADVTDTTNVTAAGALMDSELTSIASVKALNQGVATTDSPTFAGATVNGTVEFDGLSGTGAVTVTDILDQDDMSGNSATALATQQSIKSYVDSQVATSDTLAEVLANGNATGGTDVAFGDNDKAIFGAGSDLQIYHTTTGNHSIITESGSGNLILAADNLEINNAANSANKIVATTGGAVTLYHNNSAKLATTSTGIDVTGVITTDGMTTSADINFGDNDKAVFGAGSDLQIYHDGSNSYVQDTGDGDLILQGTNVQLRSNNTMRVLQGVQGAETKIFYNNAQKLATTSTGIDVTGTVTADGLTVSGSFGDAITSKFENTGSALSYIEFENSAASGALIGARGQRLSFLPNGTETMVIDSAGNVGIGTSSPNTSLHISKPSTATATVRLEQTDTTLVADQAVGVIEFEQNDAAGAGVPAKFGAFGENANAAVGLRFYTGTGATANERMRIDSAGNVGIGTSSPSAKIHLDQGASNNGLILDADTAWNSSVYFWNNGSAKWAVRNVGGGADRFSIYSYALASDAVSIDSSGNVGIGESDPQGLLHVDGFDYSYFSSNVGVATLDNQQGLAIGWNKSSGGGETVLIANQGAGSAGGMAFATNTSAGSYNERMRIDSSGGVLIGTTVNYGSFQGGYVLSKKGYVFAADDTGSTDNRNWIIAPNGSAAGSLDFIDSSSNTSWPNNAYRMSITKDGNVGIGTSSPSGKIHSVAADAQVAVMAAGDVSDPLYPAFGFDGQIGSNGGRGAGMYLPSDSTLAFSTAGAERMRLDTSGNLLVGKTVNNTFSEGLVAKAAGGANITSAGDTALDLNRRTSDGTILNFRKDNTTVGSIQTNSGRLDIQGAGNTVRMQSGTSMIQVTNGTQISLETAGAERARIDSSGNLLVGTTDTVIWNDTSGEGVVIGPDAIQVARTSDVCLLLNRQSTDGVVQAFASRGVQVGDITVSVSSTAYNTSSDQRLKDNIVDAPSASDDIDAIQVRSFDWKADGSHQKYGMVAQELNTVAPEAVSTPEDPEDMLGVDYSKLVPMLVKEIQSLRARVAQLETN